MNEILKDQVLEILRGLVNPELDDAELHLCIGEGAQRICNYCNFSELGDIPEALVYTWAYISAAIARRRSSLYSEDGGSEAEISALSVGDISVKYGEDSASKKEKEFEREFLSDYISELNRFRKFKSHKLYKNGGGN